MPKAVAFDLAESGRRVFEVEIHGLEAVAARIDGAFTAACRLLLACQGRVVCIGMGKSGHIARKIAATFASTGTPAFYVHPGEAGHGDLGMITDADVVLALSNSGETDELLMLLPVLKRQGMDFAAHAPAQGRVDHPVARQRQFAGEGLRHDGRIEMHPVGALDLDARAGQALFDQLTDLVGVHGPLREARKLRAIQSSGKPRPACRPSP
jgi:hypothetical protein